jgi:hypothetical protein
LRTVKIVVPCQVGSSFCIWNPSSGLMYVLGQRDAIPLD